MSLKELVQYGPVRRALDGLLRPGFRWHTPPLPLVAPALTQNYSWVGTAFDYLFRFWLEANHSRTYASPWIAREAVNLLDQQNHPQAPAAAALLKTADAAYQAYLTHRQLTPSLAQACLALAQLDVYYRRGQLPANLGVFNPKDILDLLSLCHHIPTDYFLTAKTIYLNPSFTLSWLVAGADADLILDTTLLEIKTSQSYKVPKEYLYQILGYYLLNHLSQNYPIQEIGFYLPRFGYVKTMSLEEVIDYQALEPTISRFIELAQEFIWKNNPPPTLYANFLDATLNNKRPKNHR